MGNKCWWGEIGSLVWLRRDFGMRVVAGVRVRRGLGDWGGGAGGVCALRLPEWNRGKELAGLQ